MKPKDQLVYYDFMFLSNVYPILHFQFHYNNNKVESGTSQPEK